MDFIKRRRKKVSEEKKDRTFDKRRRGRNADKYNYCWHYMEQQHYDESARCLRDRRAVSVKRVLTQRRRELPSPSRTSAETDKIALPFPIEATFCLLGKRSACACNKGIDICVYQGWCLRKSPPSTCRFCLRPESPNAAFGGLAVRGWPDLLQQKTSREDTSRSVSGEISWCPYWETEK